MGQKIHPTGFRLPVTRTLRSSASIVEKFLFDAYQRDAQLRVTGRRKPVG